MLVVEVVYSFFVSLTSFCLQEPADKQKKTEYQKFCSEFEFGISESISGKLLLIMILQG